MMIVMEYAAGGTLQNYLLSKVNNIFYKYSMVKWVYSVGFLELFTWGTLQKISKVDIIFIFISWMCVSNRNIGTIVLK